MQARKRMIAERQARRWAYESHFDSMSRLPAEVDKSIDWAAVAHELGLAAAEPPSPTILDDMQRMVDYLYEDEASDYQDLERYLQRGHIFESILAVQRWLCTQRT